MKITFIKTILLFTVLLLGEACSKNYLDRKPSDLITGKEVFNNIENAEKFVNVIYDNLPNIFKPASPWMLSSATDETNQAADNSVSYPDAGNFNTGAMSPSNFPLADQWSGFYAKIRACNIFLGNFELVPEDVNYPERRNRLRGEALTLRAFYYFELMIRWGGVPLILKEENPFENPDNIFYKRNTIDEVTASILKDLQEAENLLPLTYAERPANWGRVSKMVVLALRSRVLLFYASPLFNPAGDRNRWTQAALAGKVALDSALSNGYTLHSNYGEIFTQYLNREVIWSRPAPGAYRDGGIDQEMNPRGSNGYGNINPLQELVDDYEMRQTGLSIKDAASGYNPQKPYDGRDTRFYATILYPGATWKGRTLDPNGADVPRSGQISANYWPRKFLLESVNLFTNTGAADRKWVLIRTAELYLNYAEALNEAGGAIVESRNALNAVRRRVGLPDYNGSAQDALRGAIRHERRIELALEDHRFWDVRRWKIAEITDNKDVHGVAVSGSGNTTYTYPVLEKRVFDAGKNYWLPIPQAEIDKVSGRNPEFKQNPGW